MALSAILGLLKFAAKKTSWVWDDRVVTLLIGLVRMSRGRAPVRSFDLPGREFAGQEAIENK